MKNSRKGSTLAMALCAMFLVSALGVGAMNYATGNGPISVHQNLSNQTFWLADAGVTQAVSQLPPATACAANNGNSEILGLRTTSGQLNGQGGYYSKNVYCIDQYT